MEGCVFGLWMQAWWCTPTHGATTFDDQNVTFVGALFLFHLWSPPCTPLRLSLPPSYLAWPQWLPSTQHLA
jgi:hypothetical protein